MEVERYSESINVSSTLNTLLSDFSAVIDYRTLRDSLPQRLAVLLKCRYVLLYLRIDETLQLTAGSAGDQPGWSADLLSVAHVNPISLTSDAPESYAWRTRKVVRQPLPIATQIVVPLVYRQRAIGVMVALRGGVHGTNMDLPPCWLSNEEEQLGTIAGVVALLLENTRLLEHDRERIHELSLLNSISSQLTCSLYEKERLRHIIVQRTREITSVDLCDLLEPGMEADAIPWVTLRLRDMLLQRLQGHRSQTPLIFERPGNAQDQIAQVYFEELPARIMTFFVLPLFSARARPVLKPGRDSLHGLTNLIPDSNPETDLVGCIIGAYHCSWKMRQSETALLHVLASQASAVLENIQLMTEVVEARNEARKLLRQVLDDKRLNALILESVPSGLITTDLNGHIHMFNRAAAVILGYHPYEVLGQPLQKILDLSALRNTAPHTPMANFIPLSQQGAFLAGMHAGEVMSETILTTDRYDRELVLDVDVRPLYDDSSKHVGMLTTFIDVTSMHRLEEEKRRLDHLASLGEMAASVAHEVRNPLASIKTSIQMLQDDIGDSSNAVSYTDIASSTVIATPEAGCAAWMQESIAVMLKEVERLDIIVRDLLLFARPHQLRRMRCDIVDVCEHMLAVVQSQCIEGDVEIHRIFDELPCIWIDIGQVEQVLLNLYLNALQAMSDGGILTIACHRISAEQAIYDTAGADCPPTQRPAGAVYTGTSAYARLIDRHASQQEYRVEYWLEIVVSDTGVGIAPDQLKHIFQPFYTTKAHGIGLGLAITRRLVEDHGGYLRIESQYGYGTAVAVRLPFVTHCAAPAEEALS
jgi:PAS domain S-box